MNLIRILRYHYPVQIIENIAKDG